MWFIIQLKMCLCSFRRWLVFDSVSSWPVFIDATARTCTVCKILSIVSFLYSWSVCIYCQKPSYQSIGFIFELFYTLSMLHCSLLYCEFQHRQPEMAIWIAPISNGNDWLHRQLFVYPNTTEAFIHTSLNIDTLYQSQMEWKWAYAPWKYDWGVANKINSSHIAKITFLINPLLDEKLKFNAAADCDRQGPHNAKKNNHNNKNVSGSGKTAVLVISSRIRLILTQAELRFDVDNIWLHFDSFSFFFTEFSQFSLGCSE